MRQSTPLRTDHRHETDWVTLFTLFAVLMAFVGLGVVTRRLDRLEARVTAVERSRQP